MSRNTTGDLAGLHKTVDFIEAEEAGCQEASDIHESSQVSGIRPRSTFKQSKSDEFRQKPCGYCGGPKHGNNNNSAERQKDCKAFGKTGSKCKRENHLSNVCRSRPKPSSAEKPSDTAANSTLGFIAGNFFSITVGEPPAPSSLPRPATWPHSWTAQWAATPSWRPRGSWSFPPPRTAQPAGQTVLCHNRFSVLMEVDEQ